jgi:hypothetical protein
LAHFLLEAAILVKHELPLIHIRFPGGAPERSN